MAQGGQIPANLAPLLQQYIGSGGLMNSAQAGQTNVPMAGGSPMATPNAPVAGPQASTAPMAGGPLNVTGTATSNQPNTGTPASPYSAFLSALQQIQQANPIQAIGQVTPPGKVSRANQQAKIQETGVG